MNSNKYNATNTVASFAAYVSTFILRHNLTQERVAQSIKDTRDGIVSRYKRVVTLCVAFVNVLRGESALLLHWCATKVAPTAENVTVATAGFPAWERPEGGFETLTLSNGTTFGVYFPPAEVPDAPPEALPITKEEAPVVVQHEPTSLLAKYDREATYTLPDHVETPQTQAQSEGVTFAPNTLVAHVRRERVSKRRLTPGSGVMTPAPG